MARTKQTAKSNIQGKSQGKKSSYLDKASKIVEKKKSESETVSEYVRNTRTSLALDIQVAKHKMSVLDTAEALNDSEKIDFLFGLIDKDSNNSVNVAELSDAVRKGSASLSFQDTVENAVKVIAANDDNNDAVLSRTEFGKYIEIVAASVGSTVTEVTARIIMEVMFSKGGNTYEENNSLAEKEQELKDTVKSLGIYYDVMKNPVMHELWDMFDSDKDGTIKFTEVAMGLYRLKGLDMKKATRQAMDLMDLLLQADKNDARTLNYEQFTRLILNLCAADDEVFSEISEELILGLQSCQGPMSREDYIQLDVAQSDYKQFRDVLEASYDGLGVWTALHYAKTDKLFDLWDKNDDGYISLEELALESRKFHKTNQIVPGETVRQAKTSMEAFDKDSNKKLDRKEFALFLVKFAKQNNEDLLELIDFLAVTSLMEENSAEEEKFIRSIIGIGSQREQPTDLAVTNEDAANIDRAGELWV